MYTVYIPKYQGEYPDFAIVKILKMYMKKTSYNCLVLSSPGYMSKNKNTIKDYSEKLISILTNEGKRKDVSIGIFNGINGNNACGSKTIKEKHNEEIEKYMKLFPIKYKTISDHRKMLFFIKLNNNIDAGTPSFKSLNIDNYSYFLKNVEVEAIMIGSSNQSYNTYFKKAKADKGEADIFMFAENFLKNKKSEHEKVKDDLVKALKEKNQNEKTNLNYIVSKSLIVPLKDDKEYLKSVLENFLENTLDK